MQSELAKVLNYYGLLSNVQSNEQKIICPFHKDINPSMLANFNNDTWYCFGCSLTGNALDFVKRKEPELNEYKARFKLIEIKKAKINENINIIQGSKHNQKANKTNYDKSYDYYKGLLTVNWKMQSDFYKFNEYEEVRTYLKNRGFTSDILNKVGAKLTFNKNYPVIFPMYDNGIFKGWVSRTTSKEIEKKRKYLYNEGFARANTLVGDYSNKKYIVLVEGYMDRLKLLQLGLTNVVAILGWKISDMQIQKLKDENVELIISALDNDEKGKEGTQYLKKHFKVIRFKYLKNVKDPGDMSKENFKLMLDKTLIDFNKYLKEEEINNEPYRKNERRNKKIRKK